MKKANVLIWQIALLTMLTMSWEFGVIFGHIDPFYLSSPSRIVKSIVVWLQEGILFKHLWVTLSQAIAGLVIGIILGVITGFIFAVNRLLDEVLQPFISVLNALPRIAFAPLIILWFGFGFTSKVIIVVSLVFFVVFFNAYQGVKEVNPILLKNAKVLGATKKQILFHIYLPSTMTWILASLRLSVGYAVIASIIGEYMGASAGIGFLIENAQSMFDSTGVMTGLTVLTIAVAILDYFVRKVEQYFAKWKIKPNTF